MKNAQTQQKIKIFLVFQNYKSYTHDLASKQAIQITTT